MFAQVITGTAATGQHTGIGHLERDELATAVQQEPGFSGALNLVDGASGKVMLIVLWDTREQAELAVSLHGTEFRQALSRITHISADTLSANSVWEVDLEL